MKCREAREHISAYQDKMLSQEEASLLEEHLKVCKDCSGYFNEMKSLLGHVRSLEEVEPHPRMTREIMSRIRAENASSPGATYGILRRLFYPLQVKLPLQAAAAFQCVTCKLASPFPVNAKGGVSEPKMVCDDILVLSTSWRLKPMANF